MTGQARCHLVQEILHLLGPLRIAGLEFGQARKQGGLDFEAVEVSACLGRAKPAGKVKHIRAHMPGEGGVHEGFITMRDPLEILLVDPEMR